MEQYDRTIDINSSCSLFYNECIILRKLVIRMKNIELVQCLRRLRKSSPSLQNVEVHFEDSGREQSSSHAVHLKVRNSVTFVYLSQSRIGRIGVNAVLRVIATNTVVHKICLSNIPGGSEEDIFVAALQDAGFVWLEVRGVGQQSLLALAGSFRYNYSLRRLSLSSTPNSIEPDAAKALIDVLETHPSIRTFDFRGTNEEVALAVALSLQRPCSQLEGVRLENCMVDPQVSVAVAWALHFNTTLTRLELLHNTVGATGAAAFATALAANRTLKSLTLIDCRLGNKQATESLAFLIQNNTSLVDLDLEQNWIDMDGTIHLANALKRNTSLVRLSYRGNFPMLGGVMAIAEAVQQNATIQRVDIGGSLEHRMTSISNDLPLGYKELLYGLELNRAGRQLIRNPNCRLKDFVGLLSRSIDQTHLLYGLLREMPHQWSSTV